MEDFLLNVDITPNMIYLSLILFVIGKALKDVPFIENWTIIWILMFISIFVNFSFAGIKFDSLFEALISTSLAVTFHQTCKQTNKGYKMFRKNIN